MINELETKAGYERIVSCVDGAYRGFIAIHSTKSAAKIDEIYDTVLDIFRSAEAEGIPTYKAADRLAERRLKAASRNAR